MAFLTINGLTIPVAGGQQTPVRIGGAGRSLGGSYLDALRVVKREWKFRTTPLSQEEAVALIGLLNGLGQHFPYDSDSVSDGGLTPTSGDTGTVYHGANAADGDPQKLVHTAPATTSNLYAIGSAIWPAEATSNLLSADSSNAENATTGYTQVNTPSTFAANTTHYWQGAQSLEVADDGGADCGLDTDATGAGTVSPGDTVTASAWIKGAAGSESVTISILWRDAADSAVGTPVSDTYTLAVNEWRRIYVTGSDATGTISRVKVRVLHGTASATYYIDGLQASSNNSLTPWVVGAGSYAIVAPVYGNPFPTGTKECTIACWTAGSAKAAAADGNGYLWNAVIDADNYIYSRILTSTETPVMATSVAGTAVTSTAAASTFGTLVHIACVYTPTTQYIYRNGALADSDSVSALAAFDFSSMATFTVGGTGARNLNGFVDQLLVLPYALSADQIEDLYASGAPPAVGVPALVCAGDFAVDTSVTCRAKVGAAKYTPLTLDGSWANNAMIVDFTLFEV